MLLPEVLYVGLESRAEWTKIIEACFSAVELEGRDKEELLLAQVFHVLAIEVNFLRSSQIGRAHV